jgi:small nuclear ribonucleoprotein (snRNP)-like protein
LAKKYGGAVRLLVAQQPSTSKKRDSSNLSDDGNNDEVWFNLRPEERNSGDFSFVSNKFDPHAALAISEPVMVQRNSWLTECSRLDTVGQFALHLPKGDPQRVEPAKSRKRPPPSSIDSGSAIKTARDLHPFESVSQTIEVGPLARLHVFRRQRVRIVIRYVNAIRGILTGTLVAFDKHMNMILRDVEEIYSMRPTDSERSNVDTELDRQQKLAGKIACDKGEWFGRKRQMKNLLVRGDSVVLLSKADQEKRTTKSRFSKKRNSIDPKQDRDAAKS